VSPSSSRRTAEPLPPARHVDRPRLREAIDASVPHGVVLVVAPAGFGKTVLLADFAREAGFPVAWLSLSRADADTVTFAGALVEALGRAVPDLGRRVVDLAARGAGRGLPLLASELADEIGMYGSPLGLVLDDFHVLDPAAGGGAESVRIVDDLIDRAPSNLVVALGSRTLPALRHARLAAAARLRAVSADDLRFTDDEVAAYLDLPPDDARVARTLRRSAGWPAALLLDGGSERRDDTLAAYLEAEVLGQVAPEARRFLLRASVPPTLTDDLCRAVLGEPDGPRHLDAAHRAGLFVASLANGEWRLHDLFRDFLRERLRADDPAAWRALHRAVADDMVASGGYAEAVTFLIDGGLHDEAADLLVRRAEAVAAEGRWVAARRWLSALPPRIVRRHHRLLVLHARAQRHHGPSGESFDLLDAAVEACVAAGDAPAAAETLAYRAAKLNVAGRHDEALADCRRVAELLGGREHAALATARRVEGLVAAQRGDRAGALGRLAEALAVAQRQRGRAETAMCERSIGWVYSTGGDPGAAAAYYARAVRIYEEMEDLESAAEVKISLGHVFAAQGATDLARRAFDEARDTVDRSGHVRMLAWATTNLGELARDDGDFAGATSRLERALQLARQDEDYQLVAMCLDYLGQTRLLTGDHIGAEALVRQSLAEAERLGNALLVARAQTTLAMAQLARGDRTAGESAGVALAPLARSDETQYWVPALVVRAVARWRAGEPGWEADVRAAADQLAATASRGFMRGVHAVAAQDLARMRGAAATRAATEALLRAGEAASRAPAPPRAAAGAELAARYDGPAPVEARLLGRPEVTVGGAAPRDAANSWSRQATRELFFLLEAHRAGLTADQLVEHLWPDAPPGRGQAQLWNHVTRLRAVLGATDRRRGREIVRLRDGLYALSPELPLSTDVDAFEAAVARADAAPVGSDGEGAALAAADALYRGHYLDGVDAPWATARRAGLARVHARVLHRLAARALAGAPRAAVGHAERLQRTDPFSEAACELLLRAHLAAGEPDRARQAYRAFARRLERSLGVAPSRQLADMVGLAEAQPTGA
jgi:LuxR family maltose regulon positive regulatory protein